MRVEHSDLGRLGSLRPEEEEEEVERLEGRTSILGLGPRTPHPPRTGDTASLHVRSYSQSISPT